MMFDVFAPGWGAIATGSNATSATPAVDLPVNAEEVAIYNSSATADLYFLVTPFFTATVPVGDEPTVGVGMPVPPKGLIRVRVGKGSKVIRTIASAADGTFTIVPGNGG